MDLLENSNPEPTFIILDIQELNQGLIERLKYLPFDRSDIAELYWQIIDVLCTHDDYLTYDILHRLPDFNRLKCGGVILEDERNEKIVKEAVFELGKIIHQQIKNLGLYRTNSYLETTFDFIVKEVTPYKLVLRRVVS